MLGIRRVVKHKHNNMLLLAVSINLIIGLFLVYNASSTYAYNNFDNSYYFLINQAVWIFLGAILFFIIQKLPVKVLKNTFIPLYFISLFMLFLVILPTPFSNEVYGARRWLTINPEPFLPAIPLFGRLTFQPSELVKLALVLVLPIVYLGLSKKEELNNILKSVAYFLIPAVLILVEPNFKDALILTLIGSAILFAAGLPIRYFVTAIPIAILLLSLIIFTSPYRVERVKTYLGGGSTQSTSYHSYQLKVALGSGGIAGLGIGKSRQKNEYLPEVVGDSIFAIFGEEFGFLGSTTLVLLVTFLFYSIYRSVLMTSGIYERLVGVGVLTWFGVQSFLNMGSISGLIPLTGVPLPLISYGGSSLIFIMSAIAFVYKFSLEE